MRTIQATPAHNAYRNELLEAMRAVVEKHNLGAPEMLAVTAHLVGGMIAALDQTRYTPAMAMDIVVENVTRGNDEALAALMALKSAGGA